MVCSASTTNEALRRMYSKIMATWYWVSWWGGIDGREKKVIGRLVLEIWLMYEEVVVDVSKGMVGTKIVMEKWG